MAGSCHVCIFGTAAACSCICGVQAVDELAELDPCIDSVPAMIGRCFRGFGGGFDCVSLVIKQLTVIGLLRDCFSFVAESSKGGYHIE